MQTLFIMQFYQSTNLLHLSYAQISFLIFPLGETDREDV